MKNYTAQFVFKTVEVKMYMEEFHGDKPPRFYQEGYYKIGDTYINVINVEAYNLIKNK